MFSSVTTIIGSIIVPVMKVLSWQRRNSFPGPLPPAEDASAYIMGLVQLISHVMPDLNALKGQLLKINYASNYASNSYPECNYNYARIKEALCLILKFYRYLYVRKFGVTVVTANLNI